MIRALPLSLLLAACSGPQNASSTFSTDDLWAAREGQTVTLLDRNGDVIHGPTEPLGFSAPGVIELALGEGSEITNDCRIDAYTQRVIDHRRGQILGCIRFPTAEGEDEDFVWGPFYCEQLGHQGWTAVWPPNDDGMCVYRRPTENAGCFESLSFEYGMAETEIDDPDFWRDPAHHTFAVVLAREYCPAQRRRTQ